MKELQNTSIAALRKAMTVGKAVIITNAKMEWVRFSMISFFPEMYTFIMEESIPIVSAQDIFGGVYTNPVMWKVQSFRQLLLSCDVLPKKLISIGDGLHEKIACNLVCDEFSVLGVHVEFQLEPSPKEMVSQLTKLCLHMENVVELVAPSALFMSISSHAVGGSVICRDGSDEMVVA
jgi:hypothetical protein